MIESSEPLYKPKSYVIESSKEQFPALSALVAAYDPVLIPLVNVCGVTVRSAQQERSLLELLTELRTVTYHEASIHRTLGEDKHD